MHRTLKKITSLILTSVLLIQNLIYPWISILPAPPPVHAQAEIPPPEATYSALTPAPSPLENLLDLDTIFPSTHSAETTPPEETPEATHSAIPKDLPEDATPSALPSPSLTPLPTSNSSPSPAPTQQNPSPATNLLAPDQSPIPTILGDSDKIDPINTPVLNPFVINLAYPFSGSYPISYYFGETSSNNFISRMQSLFGVEAHDGIDFAMDIATPILAAGSGTVIFAGQGVYGLTIQIEHSWGTSYYGHLSQIDVSKGDKVETSQSIGLSGISGISTGPHLHFSIKPKNPNYLNGYHGMVDPLPYLTNSSLPSDYNPRSSSALKTQKSHYFNLFKDTLKGDTSSFSVPFLVDPSSLTISLKDPKGNTSIIDPTINDFGTGPTATITRPDPFYPGQYILSAIDDQGNYDEQHFSWGVLAINTSKATYELGENSQIEMAVLDSQGDTVCDAAIILEIEDPLGQTKTLSTDLGTIKINKEVCESTKLSISPDYHTAITPVTPGRYALHLQATTSNGTFSIDDEFQVVESIPYSVERITATRIYPGNIYPVIFRIRANSSYQGLVTETIPSSFKASPLSKGEIESWLPGTDSNNFLEKPYLVTQGDESQVLHWQLNLDQGQEYYFGYQYDAPDISPAFFTLGSLEIGNFQEFRKWQIAVDAIEPVVGLFSPPGTWTTALDTSLNLTQPDPRTNDLMVAVIAIRPSTATVDTPTGWTLLDSRTGTDGGAEGSDTGSVGLYWFYKVADGTEGTSTQTFSKTGTASIWTGSIIQARSSTGTYDITSGGYSINGDVTNWNGTLDQDIGLTNGDLVLISGAQNGNLSNTSAWNIAATEINVKSVGNEHGEFTTTLGNQVEVGLATSQIWEGTNTATPTITLTQSAAVSGAVTAVRIRQGSGTNRTDTFVRSAGKQIAGSTSVAVTYPEHEINDLLVIFVGARGSTNPTINTPTGWTSLGTYTGGAGSWAADSGNSVGAVFYKEARTRALSGSQTVSVTNGLVSIGQMLAIHKDDVGAWTLDSDGGTDSTADTAWTATGTGIDLDSAGGGDLLLALSSINTDGQTYSSQALSASGITFGDVTQSSYFVSGTSNDMAIEVTTGRVSAGSGTGVAPTYTSTASGSTANSPAGTTSFIKIHGEDETPNTSYVGFFSPERVWTAAGNVALNLRQPDPRSGDLMVASIAIRPAASTVNTPTGWTLLDSRTGTDGGAEAADTGSVGLYWFYKVADGTEGTANQQFTETGTTSVWNGSIMQVRSATGTYSLSAGGYSLNGDVTNWSNTLDADIGLTGGDIVLLSSATNGDSSNTSAWDVTAPGITQYTSVNEHGEFASTTGNDIEIQLAETQILEGTNTATPSVTLTQSALISGAVTAVRIRQGSGTNRSDAWVLSSGVQVIGTTSLAVPYPDHDVGDMLVLFVGNRDSTDPTPPTPTGWTSLGTYLGGMGAYAADAGNARINAYYQQATSHRFGTITVALPVSNTTTAQIIAIHKDNIDTWTLDSDGGADSTNGTAWSTTGTGIDLSSANGGDLLLVGSSMNTDAATYTSQALSASGITFGDVTETSEYRSATGNDMTLEVVTSRITSGSATGVAPTYTATASTSGANYPTGASIFIKINGTVADTSITISGTANGNDTGTVKVAVGSSVQAQTGTIGSGTWSITGVTAPNASDVITVWVDTVSDANETTAVTLYSAGNVTGMVLDTNKVSIGSNQDTSLSLTNLDIYDCTANEDVMYQAGSSTLKVEGDSCAGATTNSYSTPSLEILSGDTLSVSGTETVTTYDLTIAGTLTSSGNSIFNVSHNWDNSGTFTSSTSTVNLTGADSTTQTISGTTTFNNLAASTSSNSLGRTIRYTAGSTTTVTGTWTMTGTNTKTLTLESSSASTWIITPTAASVSYVSVSYSKNHGVDFCATNTTDGGNNTRWRTTCEPSAQSFQRKTFYDDQNSRYWRFSSDGTDIDAEYSSDGSSWNTSTTLPYNTNDFSVEYKSISGTEYVVLAVATDHDIVVRRGTLGASSVTWDGTSSVALNGASSTDSYSYPTLSLNTSNSVWVSARYYDGTSYILATNSTSYIPDTITHEETETGHTDDPGSTVTTDANLTAVTGDLYLASIGMKLNYAVTTVTGLGLTWNLLDAQCSGRSQSRVEIWYAQGTPSGDGTVTADITSGVQDSAIAVSRYSGVSTTDALGALVSANSNGDEGACSGGTDANSYSTSLTTTANNSLIFSATTLRQESHTPGTGYTERADRNSTNVNTGTRGSVATQEKLITSAGVNTVDGSTTSTANVDYAVIATEILPFISEYTVDQAVSSWVWSTSPYQLGMSDATDLLYSSISPLPNEDMYVTMRNSDAILGCIWDASEGNWEDSSGSSCQVQTGTAWLNSAWGYRTKLTIDNTKLGSDVSDYPLYIDLSDLPAGFHTNVNQTDGRDIRVTKADGTTELPREVVFYDNATDTGELHAKYTGTLSSGSPTDIYIYYGNAGASDYATTDTFGRNNVWTNSYAAVYHLRETGNGTTDEYKDSVGTNDGTGGNGSSTETPAANTGQLDGAQDFDGTDDFIQVEDDATLDITSQITVSAWIYSDGAQDQFDKVVAKNKNTYYPYQLQFGGAADDKLSFSVSDSTEDRSATSNADIPTTTWTHVTGTYDGSTVRLYVGDTAQTTTYSGSFSIETNNNPLLIGGRTSQFFNGRVDELRISSTARTSGWITTEYNNQNNPGTFYSSFGTEEPRLDNADSIDTTTTLSSDYLSLLSDGTDLHLTYVDDETTDQISYRRYSAGSWSAATLVADAASNDDTYPTISLDTTNNNLYVLWIDSSSSDIYYSSCETSTGCDDPSEWSAETNHQSTGSNLQITSNIAAAEKIFYLYSDGATLMWDDIAIGVSNTAPDAPTSLLQLTTGDVTLSTGDWHKSTSIKFSATATDTDNPDTLQLCIEIDQLGTGFSNAEDSCGTGGSYLGSGITLTHTITVTDAQEYHWQARIKDSAGEYSAWVSYDVNAESARDVGIDTTAPTGGVVYDGTSSGVDVTYSDSSLSSLSANWDSINTDVSGLSKYEYSIGTTIGGTEIKTWTDISTSTSVTATGLTLSSSTLYYVNVRTTDAAGNVSSSISSNGQLVSPSISFAVSPLPVTFANINAANSYSDTKNTILTTSTNAYNGYVIRAFVSDYLRSDDGSSTISDFSAGSYASPSSWTGSETGLGYTSSDTTIGGLDKFASGTLYAPFSHTGPGDIVADHTNTISGTPVDNEVFTLTYKVKTPAVQDAKRYSNTVILTATAQY